MAWFTHYRLYFCSSDLPIFVKRTERTTSLKMQINIFLPKSTKFYSGPLPRLQLYKTVRAEANYRLRSWWLKDAAEIWDFWTKITWPRELSPAVFCFSQNSQAEKLLLRRNEKYLIHFLKQRDPLPFFWSILNLYFMMTEGEF